MKSGMLVIFAVVLGSIERRRDLAQAIKPVILVLDRKLIERVEPVRPLKVMPDVGQAAMGLPIVEDYLRRTVAAIEQDQPRIHGNVLLQCFGQALLEIHSTDIADQ
ncbi:hypothetical protein D9M69_653700 [compost metagenome]